MRFVTLCVLVIVCAAMVAHAQTKEKENNECFRHLTRCARSCNNAGCMLKMCDLVLRQRCSCANLRDVLQMQLHYVTEAVVHQRHECFAQPDANYVENES